jgi:hypothetical protein
VWGEGWERRGEGPSPSSLREGTLHVLRTAAVHQPAHHASPSTKCERVHPAPLRSSAAQVVLRRLMASVWLPPAAVLEWLEQHTQIRCVRAWGGETAKRQLAQAELGAYRAVLCCCLQPCRMRASCVVDAATASFPAGCPSC